MSYKWQELLTLREHPSSPPVFFGGVRVAHLFKLWKDNPEKNGNIDEENKTKTTQHVLDIIVRKQTQIT
jgi:hypothetical protein